MSVTVHAAPGCVACEATARRLDRDGIPHGITLLTEESAAFWRGQGYSAAPIVTSPIGTWAGFRPDLLTKLKEHTA